MSIDINKDLLEYYNGSSEGRPFLAELERVRAKTTVISILEQRIYHAQNYRDRKLIPRFYEFMADIYDIPFPTYLLELLYYVEERGVLYERYRDHILHLFYVFCLGCYIYDNSSYYNSLEIKDIKIITANWIVAAFLHDLGYAFGENDFKSKHETSAEFQKVVRCGTGDIKRSFDLFWFRLLTATGNGQPEFAVPGSAANAIQKVERRNLELAFPCFWSSDDEFCKFDQFHDKDLFEKLPKKDDLKDFTGEEINIYDFYNIDGIQDHGLVSSLFLLYILEARNSLLSSNNLPKEIADFAHKRDSCCNISRFKDGIWAIALHNLRTKHTGVSIKLKQIPPLISLLLLSDGLQCWDRQYFKQKRNKLRVPLPSNAVGIKSNDGKIFWHYNDSYSNEPEYIDASYDCIIIDECTSFLLKNEVVEIIKKGLD